MLPTRERDGWDEVLTLLGLFGLDAPVSLRQFDGELWEIRAGRHRVAYVIARGPEMVLLHAFKKQGQRAARSDLDLAFDGQGTFWEGFDEEAEGSQSPHWW